MANSANNSAPWSRLVTNNSDPSSIYYIHPSDAHNSQLVSVKFNGTGYATWKRSMLLSLSGKNKLLFIDGSAIKPTNPDELKVWERCNDLVCSWLLCNLDESISSSVLYFKTAREIWIDLKERYIWLSIYDTNICC